MTKAWWKEAVVYQIYPRSFMDGNGDGIGDLVGITSRLDYLQELGIDVIWLSPVYKSPNDDNGYDISDYRDIMDEFGTMEQFDAMLEEAHRRGIKIMMDLVVNHSSDEHAWFMEARKSKDNPYRDYYIWRPGREGGGAPNNWVSCFGGSAWEYDEPTDEYYLHLFTRKQPDLNWENPRLRREVYDLMTYWLDKGVDGFRMDVINFISKVEGLPDATLHEGLEYAWGGEYFLNGPHIHEYLQEMNAEVLSRYPVMTVGEMPAVAVEEAKLYTGSHRNELQMVFHFEHVAVGNGKYGKWITNPWNLTELKAVFAKWQYGLREDGWNSLYWSNHDQPRAVSRFASDKEEYRFVSATMLATCLHLHQGTPYIYQGEEIGMTNVAFASIEDYRDVETHNAYRDLVGTGKLTHEQMMDGIHKRSRDNARTPMQWSNAQHGGFTTGTPWIAVNPNYSHINVEQSRHDSDSIYHYYRSLIRLRKTNPIMVYGDYDLLLENDERIYAFTRTLAAEKWLVLCNFSDQTVSFPAPREIASYQAGKLIIGNYKPIEDEMLGSITLRPYEARVYELILTDSIV